VSLTPNATTATRLVTLHVSVDPNVGHDLARGTAEGEEILAPNRQGTVVGTIAMTADSAAQGVTAVKDGTTGIVTEAVDVMTAVVTALIDAMTVATINGVKVEDGMKQGVLLAEALVLLPST